MMMQMEFGMMWLARRMRSVFRYQEHNRLGMRKSRNRRQTEDKTERADYRPQMMECGPKKWKSLWHKKIAVH
jgi:hypothetical protein